MTDEEFLNNYKKAALELRNDEILRRAVKLGKCSLGDTQKSQKTDAIGSLMN